MQQKTERNMTVHLNAHLQPEFTTADMDLFKQYISVLCLKQTVFREGKTLTIPARKQLCCYCSQTGSPPQTSLLGFLVLSDHYSSVNRLLEPIESLFTNELQSSISPTLQVGAAFIS